jgi:hypothetical protein
MAGVINIQYSTINIQCSNFANYQLQTANFLIDAIYLVNVVGPGWLIFNDQYSMFIFCGLPMTVMLASCQKLCMMISVKLHFLRVPLWNNQSTQLFHRVPQSQQLI